MHSTAEDIRTQVARAAAAVRAYHRSRADWGADDGHELAPVEDATRAAREQVAAALREGATVAQIAAQAGVRQLLVVGLVADDDARAAALLAARHDADRYFTEVMAATRREVLARWRQAGGDQAPRGTKTRLAGQFGISRVTLDDWLAGV